MIYFPFFILACLCYYILGDPARYNVNNRQVLGPTIPKLETGQEACQRSSWLSTRMHLPLRKNFFYFLN